MDKPGIRPILMSITEERVIESVRLDHISDVPDRPRVEPEESTNETLHRNQDNSTFISMTRNEFDNTPTSTLMEHVASAQLNEGFYIVLFEYGLKSVAMLFLAIGIVSSVVYLGRQVIVHPINEPNYTWKWIASLRCIVVIATTSLILWSLIIRKSDYLEDCQPENPGLFYIVIVISAVISFLHLVLMELKNYQLLNCLVPLDLVLPVLQMIFIMSGLLIISGLILQKIKPDAPQHFYMVYKAATTLFFIHLVSCLIFDMFDIESWYIQKYISNHGSTDVFCYQTKINESFFRIQQEFTPYVQVFTIIFFVTAIAILLKPLQQFDRRIVQPRPDTQPSPPSITSDRTRHETFVKYNSITVIYVVVAFVIATIGIPLDVFGLNSNITKITSTSAQIVFNAVPMVLLTCVGYLSVILMNKLHCSYPRGQVDPISTVDHIIIWASLCGHLVWCFKVIINSSHANQSQTFGTLRIALYIIDIVQSMFQAIVLNYAITVKHDHTLEIESFVWISNLMAILISTNFGLFATDIYLLSGQSSFKVHSARFYQITWGALSCISDSMTLIFRGYSAVYLLQFMSKLRYRQSQ